MINYQKLSIVPKCIQNAAALSRYPQPLRSTGTQRILKVRFKVQNRKLKKILFCMAPKPYEYWLTSVFLKCSQNAEFQSAFKVQCTFGFSAKPLSKRTVGKVQSAEKFKMQMHFENSRNPFVYKGYKGAPKCSFFLYI